MTKPEKILNILEARTEGFEHGKRVGKEEAIKEIEKILEGEWIADRIDSEFRKHYGYGLRFSKIAQGKIRGEILQKLKEMK